MALPCQHDVNSLKNKKESLHKRKQENNLDLLNALSVLHPLWPESGDSADSITNIRFFMQISLVCYTMHLHAGLLFACLFLSPKLY